MLPRLFRIRFSRYLIPSLALVILLETNSGITLAQSRAEPIREWIDAEGKFSVNAKFIKIVSGEVYLEDEKGSEIIVEVSRLSPTDVEYLKQLQKKSSPPLGKSGQNNFEARLLFADRIYAEYERLVSEGLVEGSSRKFIELRLAEIKPYVGQNAVLIEGKFFSPLERKKAEEQSEAEILEGLKLMREGDYDKGVKRVRDGGAIYPPSSMADFVLGLINATVTRNQETAKRHFTKVIETCDFYEEVIGIRAKAIKSAALNNLGLISVRLDRLSMAEKYWRDAFGIYQAHEDDIKYNFAHLMVYVIHSENGGNGSVLKKPTSEVSRKLKESVKAAKISAVEISSHRSIGWRYLNYPFPESNPNNDQIKEMLNSGVRLNDDACLGCIGSGRVRCTRCSNGAVAVDRTRHIQNAAGQNQIIHYKDTVKCGACKGQGTVDCRACDSGQEVLPR